MIFVLKKNVIDKTQFLLSLSLHYLASENTFFFRSWFHAQFYDFFPLPRGEKPCNKANIFFITLSIYKILIPLFLVNKLECAIQILHYNSMSMISIYTLILKIDIYNSTIPESMLWPVCALQVLNLRIAGLFIFYITK